MSCKKGGFVSIKHKDLRDLTAKMLSEVSKDTEIELLQQCHVMKEQEKKRAYNERVLRFEHGTFTPLLFIICGSTGRE